MSETTYFGRKFNLVLKAGDQGLDLSDFRCRFNVSQADFESPNNASIRVYNLSDKTISHVQEYGQVVLQAGYDGRYGVIFQGNIKQFGIGKENAKDTYLDIFAADGDEGYNFGVVNKTLAPGATQQDQLGAAINSMQLLLGYAPGDPGVSLPRGKVMFAMARDVVRQYANSRKASWSIQGGAVQIIPLDGYKPGEILTLSSATGVIGQPEQTNNGVSLKHLLNPSLFVGQAVRIDNKTINRLIQANKTIPPVPYNQRVGIQQMARLATDGLYRLLVVEHEGDTRGMNWYSNIVALAIDSSSGKVKPYG